MINKNLNNESCQIAVNEGDFYSEKSTSLLETTQNQKATKRKRSAPAFNKTEKMQRKIGEWMLEELKKYGFVYKHTRNKTFERIFAGKLVEKKIIWTGNIDELAYFVNQLVDLEYIKIKIHEKWLVTCNCFDLSGSRKLNPRNLKGLDNPSRAYQIKQIADRGSLAPVNEKI